MANKADNMEAIGIGLSELQQENALLLVQLYQAQEELEHSRNQKSGMNQSGNSARGAAHMIDWAPDELPEIHAENRRLQALVDVQRNVHKLEATHALNARLGNILIEGVDAPRSLLSVPGRLVKIWRQSSLQTPPAALGGKDFSEVIAAFRAAGFTAVEKLTEGAAVPPAMQANAYTALARQLMKGDRANAAEASRRAYALDPKAFRLKWLAFRLHEAGDVIEAEAMLDVLPSETQFSDSEARQARQLRSEAEFARQNEAKRQTSIVERRAAAEKRLNNLAQERDRESTLAAERGRQLEVLTQAKAKLEQEASALEARSASQTHKLSEGVRENEALKQVKAQLEMENAALSSQLNGSETKLREAGIALTQKDLESDSLLTNLHRVQEELEDAYGERERLILASVQLEALLEDASACRQKIQALQQSIARMEQDKRDFESQHEGQRQIAEGHGRELQALRHAKAVLKQEKQALAAKHEAQIRIVVERGRKLEALRQTKSLLEQERQALVAKHEVETRIADECGRKLEALRQTKSLLEQEKQALVAKHEVESRIADERGRQLEALRQTKSLLEQEKQLLAIKHEVQVGVVAERAREIDVLKQAMTRLEQENLALTTSRETQSKAVQERDLQLEALTQAKAKLEQEKQVLTAWRDSQTRAAEEHGRELETLRQAKTRLEQEKTVLEKQKQALTARTNTGDTDIDDLIADLELFFNGRAIIYVDVGAYVGDVFLKIKRMIKKFRIHEAHLFEPNPNSYAQLTRKITGSESPTVHAYNLAVGEGTDTHRFISGKSMTKALSAEVQPEAGPGDVFTARCVSLDSQSSIFTDGKINLLKIDVEGEEMDVLSSARQLLATQSIDILYIEVGFNRTGTQQTYFGEVDQFLQEYGYRVLRIYEQKEEWMRDSPLLRRANIAYMSEKFANAHPLKLTQELQELKGRINEISDGVINSLE